MCSARRIDRAGRRLCCLVALLAGLPAGRAAAGERAGEPARALPPLLVAVESARMPERLPAGPAAGARGKAGERQRLTRRLYLSAALAVSSGLAAWWSREQGDRAYARYMRAAGRRRQEKHFHRAERYDRIAGTAFVGMEVGLALTTYFLFF
jgi:hypothetical protein